MPHSAYDVKYKLDGLHEGLLNRRCYTMGDFGRGNGGDPEVDAKSIQNATLVKAFDKALKHTAAQGTTSGITAMSNVVIMAGAPDAIGRELVRIIESTEASVKFRLPSRGKARGTSRATKTTSKGQRENYTTITLDKEHEASEQWDLNYIEDSPFDVLAEETAEVSRVCKEKETSYILTKLEAITGATMASGAVQSAASAGTTAWADLVDMWAKIKSNNYSPAKAAMNPLQLGDLWKDTKFLDSLMLGQYVDVTTGKFGRSLLGFDVLTSSLVTAAHVHMLDPMSVLVYGLRRDLLTIPYEIPPKETAVQVSIRYGSDYGRKTAYIRMEDG